MRIGSTTPDLIRSAVLNNTMRPRAPVTFAPCVSSAASDMSGGKCPTAAAVNTPPLVCTGWRLQRSQGFAQGNDVKSDKLSACITAAAAAAAAAAASSKQQTFRRRPSPEFHHVVPRVRFRRQRLRGFQFVRKYLHAARYPLHLHPEADSRG